MKKSKLKLVVLGCRLRNLRKSVGLSRKDIEEKHSVSAHSIKAWEMGITEIGITRLINYLNIFKQYKVNVSLDSLLQAGENYLDHLSEQSHAPLLDKGYGNILPRPTAKETSDISSICDMFTQSVSAILNEKDHLLRTIINSLPYKIALKDDSNNLIIVNDAAAHALGGNIYDFEGRNCYEILPSMADKYYEDDLKVLTTNNSMTGIVERLVPCRAEHIWISTNKVPIINRDRKMILAIFHNIVSPKENESASEDHSDVI